MTLKLNDIWSQFNREILSQDDTDYTKKIIAINTANKYLLTRWMELHTQESWPKEFLTQPINLSNNAYSNKIQLPSDFLSINSLWYKAGGSATDTVTYTAGTGTFIAGDIITGSISGSTATITDVDSGTLTLALSSTSHYFITGETITDSTATKTGTLTANLINTYVPVSKNNYKPWDTFVNMNSTSLFNPANTSNSFSYFSFNNGYLYLDSYIKDSSTNIIKATYWKQPDDIYLLDKLTYTLSTGTITNIYGISGVTSGSTLTIDSVSGSTIFYGDSSTKSNDFIVGETISFVDITGAIIGTGILVSYEDKYWPLEWSGNNKLVFIEACVFSYFKLRQLDEAIQHDIILDNMIAMMATVNKNSTTSTWSFNV